AAPARRAVRTPGRVLAAAVAAGVAAALGVHAGATHVGLTDAAWVDREHVSGSLGTRASWCDTGLYRTTARGGLVAGAVGTGSTTGIAAVAPLRVTQTGSASTATPAGATPLGSDAYVAPVAAAALQSTSTTLGNAVTFGTVTSAQNQQYGRAASTGAAVGGSGAVSTAGVLNAATQAAGSGLPDLATVDVRALVTAGALSTGIGAAPAADLTGLRLVPGTVASTTVRDACISRPSTTRAYGVSALRLEADSTALRAASTSATAAATAAQAAITGTGTGSVAATAATTVNAVYRSNQELLNLLTPGTSTGTLKLSVPVNVPSAVAALTGQTLGAGGPVRLDLSTGRMTVDLAALTSTTQGVNGRPANSEVLTAAVMSAASSAVGTLLPAYRTSVLSAVSTALASSTATLTVSTPITLLGLAAEPSSVTFTGTLNQLRDQQGTVAVVVGVNNSCGLLTAASCTSVRNALTSATGTAQLRSAVATALTSTVYGTATVTPTPPFGTFTAAVGTATGTLQPALTNLPSVLSAQVNVQPDQAGARTPGVAFDAGELGVTALRVGAVSASRTAWLAFGVSAAGPMAYQPVGFIG
ncbi:choice-of-anchor G family protein, partial [Cellulomonas sp. PS-H5]|uniref:choice-of-anchor G family protein n=1 Tax=Cellulomonas sp. PS-H5 TaxID=2820400 RepID=UPI001C4E3D63